MEQPDGATYWARRGIEVGTRMQHTPPGSLPGMPAAHGRAVIAGHNLPAIKMLAGPFSYKPDDWQPVNRQEQMF